MFVDLAHYVGIFTSGKGDLVIDELMNCVEIFAVAGVFGDVGVFDSDVFEKVEDVGEGGIVAPFAFGFI